MKTHHQSSSKIFLIRKTSRKSPKAEPLRNKRIAIKLPNKEIMYQTSYNPNSLVSITHEVYKYIKHNSSTTSIDITKHIVQLLSQQNTNMKVSFKNIQRRVYDAINVMSSIGLIHKQQNTITYYDSNKITNLKETIKANQLTLINLLSKVNCYRTYINKNKNSFSRNLTINKLYLPFIILKEDHSHPISFTNKQNGSQLVAFSHKEFDMISFDEICKQLTYDNKEQNVFIAKEIVSDKCAKYIKDNNLVNSYYKELEKERKLTIETNKEETKQYFDIDFSSFIPKINDLSKYYESGEDEYQQDNSAFDYTINASTNFYSKLSLM
jgi:hypothetical protein